MIEQLSKLEEVTCDLIRIRSLLNLMSDYFTLADPDPHILKSRYSIYSDLQGVVFGLVVDAGSELSQATDALYALRGA